MGPVQKTSWLSFQSNWPETVSPGYVRRQDRAVLLCVPLEALNSSPQQTSERAVRPGLSSRCASEPGTRSKLKVSLVVQTLLDGGRWRSHLQLTSTVGNFEPPKHFHLCVNTHIWQSSEAAFSHLLSRGRCQGQQSLPFCS